MSSHAAKGLEVALLCHRFGATPATGPDSIVEALAQGLSDRGHRATVISAHQQGSTPPERAEVTPIRGMPEAMLRARGFEGPLTQIPSALRTLRRGGFDLAHAFSTIDAQTALLARRLNGRPVLFTCVDPPTRANLAARRLSLSFARRAFFLSDVVVASGTEAQRAIERWLGLEVEAVDGGDAEAYESIYRRCLRGIR